MKLFVIVGQSMFSQAVGKWNASKQKWTKEDYTTYKELDDAVVELKKLHKRADCETKYVSLLQFEE